MKSEEAERVLAISSLRCRLRVATVRTQCYSLHSRLETLGPGTTTGRRLQAAEVDMGWRQDERSFTLARKHGRSAFRTWFVRVY